MIIGHIGLIQKSKKQDFVLNVIHELSKKGVDVIGLFPGEVREQEYMDFLKEKVKELKLESRVIFMGRRNDIPELLKVMDILIIPSSFEGFPLAGLEAAAAGVPVAACNVAGANEFIEVSGNGATFKENDLTDALRAIKEINSQRDRMIQEGRAFVSTVTRTKYYRSLYNIFSQI